MSSDRDQLKAAFLKDAGLAAAERRPLPADASTRSYERLVLPSGATLMLMDAPPVSESPICGPDWSQGQRQEAGWNAMARLAAGRIDAFAATAAYLRDQGLSAPKIEALDAANGLAVIEDFGDGVFARLIEQGQDEAELYFAAMDAQATLHQATPPKVLSAEGLSWPLLTYDAVALKAGADLFVQWQPKLTPSLDFGGEARAEWDALWTGIARRGEAAASVFIHRDFHAENLIWLPDRDGAARVGLIDFQDALLAHPSWDLHSLLQDARRDVSPELEAAALGRYFSHRPGLDREAFMADYASLAVLNEARILGVFARLIVRDGKPRYRQFMPRMWAHLQRNLQNPALADLKRWFDRHVPVEGPAMSAPKVAMVLAAGLGTRMRPLTNDRTKAMVEVAGKMLIDHTLDRLAEAGVETAVVNVHHFADDVEAHLAKRTSGPRILISNERASLLDSGGGIAHALPLLGDEPFFVANIDNVWIEGARPALLSLADHWDPARMDICVLLAPRERSTGFERPEGFMRDEQGRLTHSNSVDPLPPYNNVGFQILNPAVLEGEGSFSVVPIWKALSAQGRLHGAVMDGFDMHISDTAARDAAEARLKASA